MTDYIIVCAGGFGREIYHALMTAMDTDSTVLGFLDRDPKALDDVANRYPPLLGHEDDYDVKSNERYFVASGIPEIRKKIATKLRQRNASFATIIHSQTVLVDRDAVGNGSFIGPHSFLSCEVSIGRFVSLNCNLTVGHDVVIEDFVEVGPGSAIGGFCHIEEGVHIGPNCTIAPGVRVGAWSKISANTAVMRDVPPCSYVVGVPGVVHRDFFLPKEIKKAFA